MPTARTVETLRCRSGRQEDRVEILVDDPVCAEDTPYQARRLGYQSHTEAAGGQAWSVTLTAGANGKAMEPGERQKRSQT